MRQKLTLPIATIEYTWPRLVPTLRSQWMVDQWQQLWTFTGINTSTYQNSWSNTLKTPSQFKSTQQLERLPRLSLNMETSRPLRVLGTSTNGLKTSPGLSLVELKAPILDGTGVLPLLLKVYLVLLSLFKILSFWNILNSSKISNGKEIKLSVQVSQLWLNIELHAKIILKMVSNFCFWCPILTYGNKSLYQSPPNMTQIKFITFILNR
jgi:hypothetical protein